MFDLVIRNGNVVDGTGQPGRTCDIGVSGGYIREVGRRLAAGSHEIAAEGQLVTPGWVDIHTHYDGQATWDSAMTPSSWHGVTTTVFGNCGVGFAPVRKGSERYLINLMEGVEDIPETVLAEGLTFDWESFGDYLNVLEQMPRSMDVGAQVPHGALRFYVMGERGAIHSEAPSEAEIEQMGELLEQALHDGALGFTTSRTTKHMAADGSPTPSLSAADPELAGLARAMRRADKGVIEVNSDFGAGDFARMRMAAEIAARPLSVLLVQVDNAPDLWRETLAGVDQAVADGLEVTAQVGSRAIGVLMTLRGTVHPFITHPLWIEMASLGDDARIERVANDADLRERLVRERPDDEHGKWMTRAIQRTFELGDPVDYEPSPERSIARLARAQNRVPFDLALELMLRDDGNNILLHPFENYCSGDLSAVEEMLCNPNSVCGVADGGAHVGLICDASSPTSLLTLWGRDRTRGDRLPLEFLVHKQTQATARTYGLMDRGVLAPGYRADINVIDFAGLRLEKPYVAYDLPAGGRRILQRSKGYLHTFVKGVEVTADGEDTGARPGRLMRGAQSLEAG
ncbi:MAG: amidohydrolase family protein [Gammaproteobacteria bacterium]|nr:amidohydrolase family protein [Gammaproteobacteria bacterium]